MKINWTPINEKDVNTSDHVLVTLKWSDDDYEVCELDYGVTEYAARHGNEWCQRMIEHVIAWTPMPNPYKEEQYDK